MSQPKKEIIKFDKNALLENVLEKILSFPEKSDLRLVFDKQSSILDNPLSTKLIKKAAEEKSIQIEIRKGNEAIPLIKEDTEPMEENLNKRSKRKITNPFSGLVISKLLITIVVGLLVATTGGALLYYYMPQATIYIKVDNEILTKGVDVIASPSAKSISEDERIIPAEVLSFTESASKTVDTTGEDEVGEKANGIVTIYNKTDSEKTFATGTVLYEIKTEGENLEYFTQSEISVPARTANITAEAVTYVSGKMDVKVIAGKIGDAYNLKEGEEVTVGDFSTNQYVGRTNGGISGGSSKKIKVVTEEDKQKALESVKTDLQFKAIESFKERAGNEQYFSEEGVYSNVESTTLSAEVEIEADKLTATQKINFKAITFYKSDLESLMNGLTEEFVPNNRTLSKESQDITIEDIKLTEEDEMNQLEFTAKFRGVVVPQLNTEELIHNLSGKSLPAAEEILKQIEKTKGYRFDISPSLPSFLQKMPFKEENIRIEIESE